MLMILGLKFIVFFICLFLYYRYLVYLNRMKDDDSIVIKTLIAGILIMFLTRYVIFDNVLSYKFIILSCVLVMILGCLWYQKRKNL